MFVREQDIIRSPQFYEQKANQLRMQNEILRRQLQSNVQGVNVRKTFSPQQSYPRVQAPVNYSFHGQVPVQQVIYNPVTEPIRPPSYNDPRPSFENYPVRARTEAQVVLPQRQVGYVTEYIPNYYDLDRKMQMNQVQEEIIELQARGYKLERQANRLSSYIKDDLRGFIRESNIHKECSYKQKYLRAISNKPKYFRFNP